ncbi:short-chain dehydrogenase/reductase SDR [Syncephalastrum racemosum]|uniref:Short-chain dehydrogenase/reductase SDR n=1 Tax=Syncephalastrum racemosum TaxID=13706 RepID=A0A1X2H8K0_SYNRA|nr:short-chain dehydrogenase/reductase SDR [Syncephalastrum racemosum]
MFVRRFDHTKISLEGKVAIVTGSNDGIGKATALVLAKQKCKVYLFCRDSDKSRNALKSIREASGNDNVHLTPVDFSDLESIRVAVDQFLTQESKLNILINNAATITMKRQLTKDGFEMQLGVNHLAPFYLTELLLPTLKASTPARIVNVSSNASQWGKIDLDDMHMEKKPYSMWGAYGRSKLCNILHAKHLDRKLKGTGITVSAAHPGPVRTSLGRNLEETYPWTRPILYLTLKPLMYLLFRSPEDGAMTPLYLAMEPSIEGNGGGYWDNLRRVEGINPVANDEELQDKLYSFSLDAVKK